MEKNSKKKKKRRRSNKKSRKEKKKRWGFVRFYSIFNCISVGSFVISTACLLHFTSSLYLLGGTVCVQWEIPTRVALLLKKKSKKNQKIELDGAHTLVSYIIYVYCTYDLFWCDVIWRPLERAKFLAFMCTYSLFYIVVLHKIAAGIVLLEYPTFIDSNFSNSR